MARSKCPLSELTVVSIKRVRLRGNVRSLPRDKGNCQLATNREKKLTTLLVQIDRRRSQVEAAQFCSRAATCKKELAYLHDTNNS